MAIVILMAVSLANQVAAVADSLRKSEERYRMLVDLSPDAIAVHSEGVVVFVNPAGLILLGAESADEVIGKLVLDIVHPAYQDMVVSRIQESVEHNRPMPVLEEKFIRLDGTTFDVEAASRPTTYMGKPSMIVIFHDITERKQAEQEIKRRADEFAALYETTRSLNTLADLQSLLQNIVSNASKLLNAFAGSMYLFDAQKEELEVVVSTDATIPIKTRLKIGEGMAGRVALSRESMMVDDYQVWEGRSLIFEGVSFRAIVEVPMIFSGDLIGVLAVYELGDSNRKYSKEDARLLSMFASQAASAVHETRQLEKNRRYLEESEMVKGVSTALRAAHTLEEMLPILLDETLSILDTNAGCIWLYDPESDSLRQPISRGWFTSINETQMDVGEGIGGSVYVSGKVHCSQEFVSDPLTKKSLHSKIPEGWGGTCLPIL
ncbi:MAG: PAS domain S-box protein, partial [Nitrosomonadaceae bacterium]|nr:PAS domain S-box protein [Nitrosomonadaceae bacterium]